MYLIFRNTNKKSFANLESLRRRSLKVLATMIFVSILVHVLTFSNLSFLSHYLNSKPKVAKSKPVKINIVDSKKKRDPTTFEDESKKKIVEVPLEKTEAPKDPKFAGMTDHVAKKESRVELKFNQNKALDPGQKGVAKDNRITKKQEENKIDQDKDSDKDKQNKPKDFREKTLREKLEDMNPAVAIRSFSSGTGIQKNSSKQTKYQKLLPSEDDLLGQLNAGYQDFIDETVALGDRVDINTGEFKYLSYFTSMRKSIELVWNYPSEAVNRGLQGEVGVEFTIDKSGKTSRIKVIKSSGYSVLDNAIVNAIALASPFGPLPKNFGKERLTVQGAFRYVLTNYAGVP